MVGDGQRIQYRPLPSLNSPLKSAHHRSLGPAPAEAACRARGGAARRALDQVMAVEDRMDGTFGRNPDIAVEPSDHSSRILRAPSAASRP